MIDETKSSKVFFNFHISNNLSSAKKVSLFSAHIIKNIDSGFLPVGMEIPSISAINVNNPFSIKIIRLALLDVSQKGYLHISKGKKGIITKPGIVAPIFPIIDYYFRADHYCKPVRSINSAVNRTFKKHRAENELRIPPGERTLISEELRYTLALRFNNQHHLSYTQHNTYYTHDFLFLIKLIGLSFKKKNEVVVLPKNGYNPIKFILEDLGIKVIEITMHPDGYDADELQTICLNHPIAAIFLSSKVSFPEAVRTSALKIIKLHELQKIYHFKVVEISAYDQYLSDQSNDVIDLAKEGLADVIYIWSATCLQVESSHIFAVAAHTKTIDKLRKIAKRYGEHATQTVGLATSMILQGREHGVAEQAIAAAVLTLKKLIIKVFNNGFWEMEGIIGDSGTILFLKPRHGFFLAGVYKELLKMGIKVVDPELYTAAGELVKGLRLEIGYYLGLKTASGILTRADVDFKSLVISSPLVGF